GKRKFFSWSNLDRNPSYLLRRVVSFAVPISGTLVTQAVIKGVLQEKGSTTEPAPAMGSLDILGVLTSFGDGSPAADHSGAGEHREVSSGVDALAHRAPGSGAFRDGLDAADHRAGGAGLLHAATPVRRLGIPGRGLRPARGVLRGRAAQGRRGARPDGLRSPRLRPARAQGDRQDPLRQDPHLSRDRRRLRTAGQPPRGARDPAPEPYSDRHPLPPRRGRGRRARRVRRRRQPQALAPRAGKPRLRASLSRHPDRPPPAYRHRARSPPPSAPHAHADRYPRGEPLTQADLMHPSEEILL